MRTNTLVSTLFLLLLPATLHSQITRDNYYAFLPGMSKIVTQTRASHALRLYGDAGGAGYSDTDANGIDDVRQQLLHRIANRFSPVLRRNNFSFPRDFKRVMGERDILFIDTWKSGQLVSSEQVPFGWSATAKAALDVDDGAARLQSVLADIDPMKSDARFVEADHFGETVLFVDFPGTHPVSWRAAYEAADPSEATVYVHFFIHEDSAATGPARFHLVAQNWFFYPFNDAANNHEGDWEHINVLLTTRDAAHADEHGRLTEAELQALLRGDEPAVQSMVIAFVDYYFHESVFTLSYLPAYQPAAAAESEESWIKLLTVWRDEAYLTRTVAERLTVGGGILATHPVGFIGGNNKGPDELFSVWPRGGDAYNRNGHGTYAFPGTWQSVGAMGSTEQIGGDAVPRMKAAASDTSPVGDFIDDPTFVTFSSANVIIVPDWERVHALFATSASARREWSWLVLPMRWGFPVAKSPGGGAVPHADVGNIAPEGPMFQPTWNRVGTSGDRRAYHPNVLRVMLAPTTPWDKLRSGWGILNVPLGLVGFLPGWNVAVTQLMPWVSGTLNVIGRPPSRTFKPVDLDLRFSSMTAGWHRQSAGAGFARLLHDDTIPTTSIAGLSQSSANAIRFGMQLYYGPKLSIENTYAKSERRLASNRVNQSGAVVEHAEGTIATRDLSGGLRYDVAQRMDGNLHVYARGGWSWMWYEVDNLTRDGAAKVSGGYHPKLLPSRRWWPNSWYGGAGVEYFMPRNSGLLSQVGYGIRAEFTSSRHLLGAKDPRDPNLGTVSRNEIGISAVIGW